MAFGNPPFSARPASDGVFASMGVVGTQGTTDIGGTAQLLPAAVDPTTGAWYVNNIGAPSGNPTAGTLNTLGTVGTVNGIGGTVQVVGTVVTSGSNVNIVTGTVNSVGSVVGIGGTVVIPAVGTIGSIAPTQGILLGVQSVTNTLQAVMAPNNLGDGGNLQSGLSSGIYYYNGASWDRARGTLGTAFIAVVNGTQQTLGTVGVVNNLVTGTLANSGSSTGVGTVTNVGSITNVGQIYNAGSIQNIVTGTLANSGTTTGVGVVTALTNGSVNILSGSIQMSPIPTIGQSTFGTHGTTGATVFGTLAGGTSSGAGTEIFITSLSLTIPSTGGSQDVSIGWGTNGGTFHAGTGRLVRGNFPAGGGIAKFYDPPINSGTNAQLTFFQAGAGTVDVDVTYFVTASTL